MCAIVGSAFSVEDIASFLIESYGNTDSAVLIFEVAEPHYVIAASTGSPSAKFMLSDDLSKPCPVDSGEKTGCEPVRISVQDFGSQNPMDAVLVKAAEWHEDQGYPQELLVVTVSKGMPVFVSQSTIYTQEGTELSWRVVVVEPGVESTTTVEGVVDGSEREDYGPIKSGPVVVRDGLYDVMMAPDVVTICRNASIVTHYSWVNETHGSTGALIEPLPSGSICTEGIDMSVPQLRRREPDGEGVPLCLDSDLDWLLLNVNRSGLMSSGSYDFALDARYMGFDDIDSLAMSACATAEGVNGRVLSVAGCGATPAPQTCQQPVTKRAVGMSLFNLKVNGYPADSADRRDKNFHFHVRATLGVTIDWADTPPDLHVCADDDRFTQWHRPQFRTNAAVLNSYPLVDMWQCGDIVPYVHVKGRVRAGSEIHVYRTGGAQAYIDEWTDNSVHTCGVKKYTTRTSYFKCENDGFIDVKITPFSPPVSSLLSSTRRGVCSCANPF